MKPKFFRIILIFGGLLLINLSCRPVITIGWQEIGILLVLILILLGPVLFRFYKRVTEFQDWNRHKDKAQDKAKDYTED